MKLVIDNRERALIGCFDASLPYTIQQLDVGDIQILDDADSVICVIERKTVEDLAASIKDGRYKEQKLRLLSMMHHTYQLRVIYIIEGRFQFNEDKKVFGLSNKSLVSSILHTSMRDGISVYNTNSVLDTSHLIMGIFTRIDKLMTQETTHQPTDNASYMHAMIKPQKKANVTEESVLLAQLSAIPSISVKKASVICKHFNCTSMYKLMKYVDFDKLKFTKELITIDGIGKTIAQTVSDHVFGKEEN